MQTPEFVNDVAKLFVERLSSGSAIWMRDVRSLLPSMPVTVTEEGNVAMSGGNAVVLAQSMVDRGWKDPRFFTSRQLEVLGGTIKDFADGISIEFVKAATESTPAKAVGYVVFNAEQVEGLPAWSPPKKAWPLESLAERFLPKFDIAIVHDQVDSAFFSDVDRKVHMPPMSAFASVSDYISVAVHELSHGSKFELNRDVVGTPGHASYAREELRAELASLQLNIALGLPHNRRHAGYVDSWIELLSAEPGEFFRAARDADRMAALVLWNVKSVERELAAEVRPEPVVPDRGDDRPVKPAGERVTYEQRLLQMFENRRAILAVPYAEKDDALKAGAVYFPPQKLWFIPETANDLAKFSKWDLANNSVTSTTLNRMVMLDSVLSEMRAMGLNPDDKQLNEFYDAADDKWVYCNVNGSKNRAGACILHLDGGRNGTPSAVIINRFSGETYTWRHDGPELTPEQQARMRAEAIQKQEAILRKTNERYEQVSTESVAIWESAKNEFHGYERKKGIGSHGARVLSGAELLKYSVFKNEEEKSALRKNEKYLLIPMRDVAGKIWSLQAISEDGKTKSFMSGGKKTGLFCLVDSDGIGDGSKPLPTTGALAFAEGYATGISGLEAIGGVPVAICFDAGNLEACAKEWGAKLESLEKYIYSDNDQYFPEKMITELAKIGVTVSEFNQSLNVRSGIDQTRVVGIGEAVIDGSWQIAAKGRYRVEVEYEPNTTIANKLSIEIIETHNGEDKRTQKFRGLNRGFEAALIAHDAMPNSKIVLPSFKSLAGKPSDLNDLAQIEGIDAVRKQLSNQLGIKLFQMQKQLPVTEKEKSVSWSR